MKKLVASFLCIFSFVYPLVVEANEEFVDLRIVAKVEDKVITNLDLSERVNILLVSSSIEKNKENAKLLTRQALNSLIDEKLQMKEAARLNIFVSDFEIKEAIKDIEKQNKLSEGGFKYFLRESNLSYDAVVEKIKAQILWQKLVIRFIRPKISVSDSEVKNEIELYKNNSGKKEYMISEIVFNINEQNSAEDVENLAHKIVKDSSKSPDAFANIAKQISSSPSSKDGGFIGWVNESYFVHDQVRNILSLAKAGQVTKPIKVDNNMMIIKIHDIRTVNYQDADSKKLEEEIKDRLIMQKLDLHIKNYMINLRRKAFIEIVGK